MSLEALPSIFDQFGSRFAPVPTLHAEPLERMLAALRTDRTLLLLHLPEGLPADAVNPQWLYACLRTAWIEPISADIWPLLESVWAIVLPFASVPDDAESALCLHTIQRNLTQRLQAEIKTWMQSASEVREASAPAISLRAVAPLPELNLRDENIVELNALLEILVRGELHTQFQPIVNLRDGQVHGYEALIRGPKGATLRRPGMMYRTADKANLIGWYDIACQNRCFELASSLNLKRLLFVNMDAEGLAFLEVQGRSLAESARAVGLSPTQIVIEICERQTVEDFPRLAAYIEELREEGFKLAIDDAGAGYNSLHTIAELHPDYVKIDRNMVRNIDVQGERRALLATLVDYARRIGTNILAEGAETREELATLIDLGVPFGQGYLMGRPQDDLRGVPRETREFIQERARLYTRRVSGHRIAVGGLSKRGHAVPADTPIEQMMTRFAKDPSMTSVVVVENGHVLGLVGRAQLENVLEMAASASASEVLAEQTAAQWMRTNVLLISADTPVGEAARQAATRTDVPLDSDIVVVREGQQYAGVLPMRTLLEAAISQHESRLRYTDPLTGLAGIVPLESMLRERLLTYRDKTGVVRVDVRDLEHINRRFGLAAGDAVVEALARLVDTVSQEQGEADDLLAHLGGDNFVILTSADAAPRLCRALCEQFDAQRARMHLPEQVRQGSMELDERAPGGKRVPLLHLHCVAVTGRKNRLSHCGQILDDLNAMLRTLRQETRSMWAVDR